MLLEMHKGGGGWQHIIVLTAPNGSAVLITGGGETVTGMGAGTAAVFLVHKKETTYTVSVTASGFVKTSTITTGTTDTDVSFVSISYAHIDLTFVDAFRSNAFTITDGTITPSVQQYFPATGNEVDLYVPSTGTWVVKSTLSGEEYKTKNIYVTSFTDTYEALLQVKPDGKTVTPTDDIETWLECGGIKDKFYTTLDEVLSDHETLQKLISDENAVDYMVRSKKFINAELISPLSSDDNKTSESTNHDLSVPYKTFDGDWTKSALYTNQSGWLASAGSSTNQWLARDFDVPVNVSGIKLRAGCENMGGGGTIGGIGVKDFKIQYSDVGGNNDADWSDAGSFTYVGTNGTAPTAQEFVLSNNVGLHRYWRIYVIDNYKSGLPVGIANLQFYLADHGITEDETAMRYIGKRNYAADTLLSDEDWCEGIVNSTYYNSVLNVSVPTMTDDTHPSGECFGSAGYNSNWHWYNAFAPNTAGFLGTNSATGQYIGYDFKKLVKLCAIKFKNGKMYNWSILTNYDIEHSDDITDPTSWSKIGIYATGSTAVGDVVSQSINMSGKAKAFRILNNGTGFGISDIEMLCREDVDESKIDIYTATNDTVYKEVSGSPVTLGTISDNGNVLRVARTDLPVGTHKLGSLTAKDPEDLTADYTKDVNIFDGMIEIMLMPDNAIYWYGYTNRELTGGWARGYNATSSSVATWSNGYLYTELNSTNQTISICSNNKIAIKPEFTKLCAVYENLYGTANTAMNIYLGNYGPGVTASGGYADGPRINKTATATSKEFGYADVTSVVNSKMYMHGSSVTGNAHPGAAKTYALWFE